ncbi:MAG: hypothetical protein JAZ02_03440 [Candidatus Thiodiazotropha endolucinida]|nr:hypothetical protein [Candidatus Thiodiazotropha endolucinida]
MIARKHLGTASAALILYAGLSFATSITERDSTQPRGSEPGVNANGQVLDPIVDGFRNPARFPGIFHDDWAGSIMAHATRDPSFYAALNVANRDYINLLEHVSQGGDTPPLTDLGLSTALDLLDKTEEEQAVVGDFCLRCHSPVGWLEGFSEPPNAAEPHLRGDFWGASLQEFSPTSAEAPDPLHNKDSEGHMDGITCDFCHRVIDNQKDAGGIKAAGNGGVFVTPYEFFTANPEWEGDMQPGGPRVMDPFQRESELCGTCHEVTNPFLMTLTDPDGDGTPVNVPHPIERTYTEWYNSAFPDKAGGRCQDCHRPMRFPGAQTWMLTHLERLWGPIDQTWTDLGYDVTSSRQAALDARVLDNLDFVDGATARISVVNQPESLRPGDTGSVKFRITNLTGHKLTTGYGEGRQMWLHVRIWTKSGTILEDGAVDPASGEVLVADHDDIFEMHALAEGYGDLLDEDSDGLVTEHEKEFHFVLLNKVVKDNRIPPEGYDKAAYMAQGAFIIPADEYADGQNWADREYTFTVPANARGNIKLEAKLMYKTFSNHYVDFLAEKDSEPTVSHGGHARDLPAAGSMTSNPQHWGEALKEIYQVSGNGPAVQFARKKTEIELNRE